MQKFILMVIALLLCLTIYAQSSYIDELLFAAKNGDTDAQYELGKIYYEGKSVPRNLYEAVKWLALAADNGNSAA